jgi:serine/threonine protein kinase
LEIQGCGDAIGVRRFDREVALGVTVKHPGLAYVFGCGPDWIAFERLEHPNSNSERRRRLTTLLGIRELLGQLAQTLAYLHSHGIVHRDVKPGHILFRDHQPVLIDLGAAGFIADDPLAQSELVGSPAWMAPEQIEGAGPAPEADVWSLCALGVALVRGKPLFRGSAADVLEQRRRTNASAMLLGACFDDDPQFLELMRAGLDVPERRPSAAEIATAVAPTGMQAQAPVPTQRFQSDWAGTDGHPIRWDPFQIGHIGDHPGQVANTPFPSTDDSGA